MARVRRSDWMEMIITVDVFLGQGQGELRWACVGGRLTMAWPWGCVSSMYSALI